MNLAPSTPDIYDMRNLYLYEGFLENIRKKRIKIDITDAKYAYHWINEGNLFDQCYNTDEIKNPAPYILRKNNGVILSLPKLPEKRYVLGGTDSIHGVCLTLDPRYISAGFTGESHICLLFKMENLMDLHIENLTNNGEAEIRIKEIPDWNKRIDEILTTNKIWTKGDGWEGYYYRPISEWLPEELKHLVKTFPSVKKISDYISNLS